MSRPTIDELNVRYHNYHNMTPMSDAINLANWAMDEALKGSIQIPPENEWPTGATAIVGEYSSLDGINHPWDVAFIFNRSNPVWKLSEGDLVFAIPEGLDRLIVGKVGKVVGGLCSILFDGKSFGCFTHMTKPFDPLKIGLRWDEI